MFIRLLGLGIENFGHGFGCSVGDMLLFCIPVFVLDP